MELLEGSSGNGCKFASVAIPECEMGDIAGLIVSNSA